MDRFFGTYHRFETVSHKEGALLLSADNLIGDRFEVEFEFIECSQRAWLINKFNKRIGYFDSDFSRRLSLLKASDASITAFLSFVAYTETDNGGSYWGEMAIVSRETRLVDDFNPLVDWLADQLKKGVRPRIDLDCKAIDKYLSSDLTWRPSQTLPRPKFEKGTVMMKDEISISDRIIEQGRKGNPGCYAITWAIFIGIAVGVFFLVKALLS